MVSQACCWEENVVTASRGQKHETEHSLVKLAQTHFQVLTTNSTMIFQMMQQIGTGRSSKGKDWRVEPEITVPEIWPNCANDPKNYPWRMQFLKLQLKSKN